MMIAYDKGNHNAPYATQPKELYAYSIKQYKTGIYKLMG